jgi:DNA (cytosine-5)-methyltransferase 1
VVQPLALRGREFGAELEAGAPGAPYNALRAGDGGASRNSLISVKQHAETVVRRLTEMECERLQGFPDGWTEGQSAAARYRQLGNSVAVPCVEWIAQRLAQFHKKGGNTSESN